MDNRRVVAAALRLPNGLVLSLPKPNRHHDIISLGIGAGLSAPLPGCEDGQGFLLDDGRYVTRKQALSVVLLNGQVDESKLLTSTLISEDLW